MESKLLLLLLITLAKTVLSRVTVLSPKALAEQFKGPLKASYSNFGRIPYGYTLTGRVYFDPTNSFADMACYPITSIHIPKVQKLDETPIVMVDRGACKFVDKVQNVENIGGHLALLVDNRPNEDPSLVIMSDDEKMKGDSLGIPGVLISYEDGLIIKKFYRANKDNQKILKSILLEIEFEMEHDSNQVNYSIYFSSEHFNVYRSFEKLFYFHTFLRYNTKLKPYYVTNQLAFGEEVLKEPKENCFSGGKYCIYPRFDLNITDGRRILMENIRQKCIYNDSYVKLNQTDIYWNYMNYFYLNCIGNGTQAKNFTDECSIDSMEATNVDPNSISSCLYKSFGVNNNESEIFTSYLLNRNSDYLIRENNILKADRENKENHNINLIPKLLINNRTFWGSWNGENIFEAICASFKNKPEVCYDEGAFEKENSPGMSMGIVILIIILVIVFNIIIFILCRRYIKGRISDKIKETDMTDRINTVVSNYLALKETK